MKNGRAEEGIRTLEDCDILVGLQPTAVSGLGYLGRIDNRKYFMLPLTYLSYCDILVVFSHEGYQGSTAYPQMRPFLLYALSGSPKLFSSIQMSLMALDIYKS